MVMQKSRAALFIIVFILTMASWALALPEKLGICPSYGEDGYYDCYVPITRISEPAAVISTALLLVVSFSMRFKKEALVAWRIFTAIYTPILILILISAPETTDPLRASFGRAEVSIFLSIIYLVISIVLIVWQSKK